MSTNTERISYLYPAVNLAGESFSPWLASNVSPEQWDMLNSLGAEDPQLLFDAAEQEIAQLTHDRQLSGMLVDKLAATLEAGSAQTIPAELASVSAVQHLVATLNEHSDHDPAAFVDNVLGRMSSNMVEKQAEAAFASSGLTQFAGWLTTTTEVIRGKAKWLARSGVYTVGSAALSRTRYARPPEYLR